MSNQYFLARIAGRDSHLRAADADREQTAERLRTSHAEGRLDMDEFQQRLERCYASKTLGELAELVSDLPPQDDHLQRSAFGSLQPSSRRLARLTPILIAVFVIALATGHHVFWLWLPIVFVVWRLSWWRRGRWASARRGPGGWL